MAVKKVKQNQCPYGCADPYCKLTITSLLAHSTKKKSKKHGKEEKKEE